jgi:hypothetical protein
MTSRRQAQNKVRTANAAYDALLEATMKLFEEFNGYALDAQTKRAVEFTTGDLDAIARQDIRVSLWSTARDRVSDVLRSVDGYEPKQDKEAQRQALARQMWAESNAKRARKGK